VIVSALDGSRGEPLHVGYPLLERLSRGDIDLVVAVGPSEEVERLGSVVDLDILSNHITSGLSDTVITATPGMELAPEGNVTVVGQ
jgi:hypothetical protein